MGEDKGLAAEAGLYIRCLQWAILPYFVYVVLFFFQAEDGIRDLTVTGVQTCALPISRCPSGGFYDCLKYNSSATEISCRSVMEVLAEMIGLYTPDLPRQIASWSKD